MFVLPLLASVSPLVMFYTILSRESSYNVVHILHFLLFYHTWCFFQDFNLVLELLTVLSLPFTSSPFFFSDHSLAYRFHTYKTEVYRCICYLADEYEGQSY